MKNVLRIPGSASPRFFLTIVVVQNVPLLMTGYDVTKSDVTGSDVTGSDVIRPKMGDSPWGMILCLELSRYTTLIFGFRGTLYISHEKLPKDCKVLCHLRFMSKVLPGPLTDLNA
jgi:hypothetical protein